MTEFRTELDRSWLATSVVSGRAGHGRDRRRSRRRSDRGHVQEADLAPGGARLPAPPAAGLRPLRQGSELAAHPLPSRRRRARRRRRDGQEARAAEADRGRQGHPGHRGVAAVPDRSVVERPPRGAGGAARRRREEAPRRSRSRLRDRPLDGRLRHLGPGRVATRNGSRRRYRSAAAAVASASSAR